MRQDTPDPGYLQNVQPEENFGKNVKAVYIGFGSSTIEAKEKYANTGRDLYKIDKNSPGPGQFNPSKADMLVSTRSRLISKRFSELSDKH